MIVNFSTCPGALNHHRRKQTATRLATSAEATVLVPVEQMLEELACTIRIDKGKTNKELLDAIVSELNTMVQREIPMWEAEWKQRAEKKKERREQKQTEGTKSEDGNPPVDRKWDMVKLLHYLEALFVRAWKPRGRLLIMW